MRHFRRFQPSGLFYRVRPNKRLLLAGRKRLRRRVVCLTLVCGGCGTPRSRSAGRYVAPALRVLIF